MTQAARKLSFEEYASLDAEAWVELGLPEGRCEFDDGDLVEVIAAGENDCIANFLMFTLANSGLVRPRLVRGGSYEIEVSGKPRTRYPDLVILREAHLTLTERRVLITFEMPPPQLVAEVVSRGKDDHKRAYEDKRQQYQDRGIPEYWLIDLETQAITVLQLVNQAYQKFGVFQGETPLASPTFGVLDLTAHQIFAAGG